MRLLAVTLLLVLLSVPLAAQEKVVTASEPQAASLTVYNQNFALVREVRTVDLKEGVNWVRVENVAAQIDPTSVALKGLELPISLQVREQNYEYDLISPEAILRKAIGEQITVRNVLENGEVQTREGVLLNGEPGQLVMQGRDGVVLQPQGEISLRELPKGLISRPALTWKLLSDRAGPQRVELSYMTAGMNWVANYVAVVNEANTKTDLNGWVTLDNGCGATYEGADLQLIAGDVRRVQPPQPMPMARGGMMGGAGPGAPQFEEKAFFEYHLYTMTEPTSIRDKETKQLGLLSATDVPVDKQFIYDGAQTWWHYWSMYRSGQPGAGRDTSDYHKVNVVLELVNSEANHMGMPLPKGTVRCYMADEKGRLQFVGEDEIDHTPRDEKLRLWIGDAFDIVGDHRRTDFRDLGGSTTEEAFEIKVRNHKEDEAITVHVVEHMAGEWRVLEKSHDYVEKDAHTVDFPVQVPAGGETVVTYRVRTEW